MTPLQGYVQFLHDYRQLSPTKQHPTDLMHGCPMKIKKKSFFLFWYNNELLVDLFWDVAFFG